MSFETIIGLEIHVELDTKSKIFCGCSTEYGAKPNTNTCPICTGLPGTLPVLNEEVINLAIKAGTALNCEINKINKTDRKNYFYPDLPKAYQISQYDLPICSGGYVDIEDEGKKKTIRLTRIHIEEDAGKLIHMEHEPVSLVDYNRTGVPLIEIVSEPDMRSPEEAVKFVKTLRSILQYAGISDCRMEQGSLRCDANISMRKVGETQLNTKVEIKNINSFKELQKALEKEINRQRELYTFGEGHKIKQETRKWDSGKGRTISMRTKEDAHDYRYFPEPDLTAVIIREDKINSIKNDLPELPVKKKERFIKEYGLSEKEVNILIEEKAMANYYEKVVGHKVNPKDAANWIIVEILRVIKENDISIDEIPVSAENLAKIIKLINNGKISRTAGKEVFDELIECDKLPEEIIEEKGLTQISKSDELETVVDKIISDNPECVEDYKNGKFKSIGYMMGQIMKETKGKANPKIAKDILEKKLKSI